MSEQNSNRTTVRLGGEPRELHLTPPSSHEYAIFEELSFVRREAQAEADLAYQAWSSQHGGETYTVFRAAQDRADAAQDQLADWVRQLAA
jgi:hypothetical protein